MVQHIQEKEMSIEQMTNGAGATNEFNAGFERAEGQMKSELAELRETVSELRSKLQSEMNRVSLAQVEIDVLRGQLKREKEKANGSGSLAELVYPAIAEKLAEEIERQVRAEVYRAHYNEQVRVGPSEQTIKQWIKEGIENNERFYTADQVDSKLDELKDRIKEDLDVEEAVEYYLSNNLEDEVKSCVRDLDFEVRVS
jgi:cysteinyl-tRNA synthetase